ncbi:MAG TPA: DUF1707 domain-containing protein [Candidatus Limnocylindria bacterium]|nr:DUF1707 domain-containing protein [Candidatus Limnocylindria bacterium]
MSLRASNEDRERIVTALQRHAVAGRLTLDEFSDRVGLVYAAATHAELAEVTRDLPAEPVVAQRSDDRRHLLLAFLLAIVTIAVLGIALALGR